jgi:hypothetical protein
MGVELVTLDVVMRFARRGIVGVCLRVPERDVEKDELGRSRDGWSDRDQG